ncbi:MAG: undecaprenyl-diphosphate phosphatase [Oscillospiraceae bacterium]|jgi:undecaprenyl-diphosphatase|nr:undecaprenyl-diphosphate phosphatase [Oscillospiraceae bacterium]
MLTYWQAVVLGVLQGLAEFLPISSSGHLQIGQALMGIKSAGPLLDILMHVGTLGAVLIVFWPDLLSMISHPLRDPRLRLLALASVPAVLAALLFDDQINALFTSGRYMWICFMATTALLFAGEALAGLRVKRADGEVGVKHALAMGVMQALAIPPGVSRSGSTIVGGLVSGLNREEAARFSFLMSAVAIVGSLVFSLKDLLGPDAIEFTHWTIPAAGMLAALVTGYVAIRWMLDLIRRKSLRPFGWYTLAVGVILLVDQLFFLKIFPE